MGTTIFLRNIIGKAAYIFLIRIIPLQRHFNTYSIFSLSGEMENFIQVIFTFIDIFNKFGQTTFIVKYMFKVNAFIAQNNTDTGI